MTEVFPPSSYAPDASRTPTRYSEPEPSDRLKLAGDSICAWWIAELDHHEWVDQVLTDAVR